MSIALAAEDLSTAVVGTTGTISLVDAMQTGSPLGVRAGRPTLRLFNESGCGLQYALGTRSERLPAGGWVDVRLNGETVLGYTVEYILPGAPVALLLATVYEAGEPIPPLPALGNSPIGIGGTVATSTTPQVINDGQPAPFEVVEATPSGASVSQLKWNNDGSGVFGGGNASVSNAGIFTLPAGAVPVASIGAGTLPAGVLVPEANVGSGYPASSLGAGTLPSGVVVPKAQSLNSQITSSDNGTAQLRSTVNGRGIALGYNDSGGTYHQVLGVNGSTGAVTAPAASIPAAAIAPGTLASGVDLTSLSSDAGALASDGTGLLAWSRALSASNQIADLQQGYGIFSDNVGTTFPGSTSRLWINAGSSSEIHIGPRSSSPVLTGIRFRATVMELDTYVGTSTTHGWHAGTGNGSGTYTHALGVTPTAALCNTANGSNSTTFGSGTYGSSTVYLYEYSAQAFVWLVWAN